MTEDKNWPAASEAAVTEMKGQARLEKAVLEAEDAFWASIARSLPEVSSGDFPADALFAFHQATMKAATIWYESNRKEVP